MIGQRRLLYTINKQIEDERFPQFALFVGEDGFGKRTLMNEISKHWKYKYVCQDVKVATIRNMIDVAYRTTQEGKCVYIIPDAHKMSLQAKNALLKIVEEPPLYATFLMSADSETSILGTIKSRAVVYRLESYSKLELKEYLSKHPEAQDEEFILSISNSISDINKALRIDPGDMMKHINSILDKADSISYANLLKSVQFISVKEEDDGFDLGLYWRAFNVECIKRIMDEVDYSTVEMYRGMILATHNSIFKLSITGINKSMLYDEWILSIRRCRESVNDYK